MKYLPFSLLLLMSASCASSDKKVVLTGPFLGIVPSEYPGLLGPEIISTSLTEYNGTFNPDGTAFFFTSEANRNGTIVYMEMLENGDWTRPATAPFSGEYSEYDPLFSPYGKRLYFSSERPVPGQPELNGTNIWAVQWTSEGWSDPQLVPLPGTGHYFSSVTSSGSVYFNDWSNGDIFEARPGEEGFSVVRLPKEINGQSDVGDAFIAADGSYLIFRGYFQDSYGQGDLYISFQTDSSWTEAINLGHPINSSAHEMCPYVTTDGKLFLFASSRLQEKYPSTLDAQRAKHLTYDNGNQNIYSISAAFIEAIRDSVFSGL